MLKIEFELHYKPNNIIYLFIFSFLFIFYFILFIYLFIYLLFFFVFLTAFEPRIFGTSKIDLTALCCSFIVGPCGCYVQDSFYMLSCVGLISSPEQEVLKMSYCDRSMSAIPRSSCVVRRQQIALKAYSSYTLTQNLIGSTPSTQIEQKQTATQILLWNE